MTTITGGGTRLEKRLEKRLEAADARYVAKSLHRAGIHAPRW
jgi:hypothetical protein